ncbi:GntR family transcriptional regulator [Lentzea pudingi]|uniref:GntR family transcriptional regulator n=1 Tax=Lentzea pudingi TaxID=1789439 RepID=A0ABQ2IBE6_9PSEU|nr:GntR family transcriptional regulator [Lentzea pudingi]GGN04131.1 GntR family transcriptional regulator [Lentzea pudingi]
MLKLDPNDSRAPFQQIADHFRRVIAAGGLAPGDKLPSHGKIAVEVGVAVGTVKHAFSLLQSEGLIVTRQGQGAFVRTKPLPEAADDSVIANLQRAVEALTARVEAVERKLGES